MRKTIRIVILAFLCAAAYSACQRASEEKKAGDRPQSIDSLNRSFQSLNDSLAVRWEAMIAEDDQKLADMRRLLQEISYFPVYNKARLETLQTQLQHLYDIRYEPESMTSEQIDQYDSATAALKNEIIQFANEHPDVEKYPLVGQLIDSIEASDQRVIFHRVKYDNYARDYNEFLETNREFVRTIDTTDLHQKRPLFQLSE